MKFSKLLILLLILSVTVQANPRSRRHHHRPTRNYHHHSYYPNRYSYHYVYGNYRYYTPAVVTTRTTTTYPSNLVTITAESVAEDIIAMNRMMSRGVISEKDFERAKKTLLNRIGMSVNPQAQEATTADILNQIETLYEMKSGQLITSKEFKQQKSKLLAMI